MVSTIPSKRQIRDLTVGRTATDIASALAIPGSAKALLPHIERRLSVEQRDGKPVVVVLDPQGKLSAATLDELKVEFANDVAFAPLIAGSKASGGGPTVLGMAAGPPKEKLAAPKRNEPRRLPASSQISLSSREITHVFGPNAGFQPVFLQESFFQNLAAALAPR